MKTITLFPQRPTKDVEDLFGIFFEDLNHAADGGLYGELVQNRSFEFAPIDREEYHSLTAWRKSPEIGWNVETASPIHSNNPHYLHVHADREGFIANEGYNAGICLEAGKEYEFSIFAKGQGQITVAVAEFSEAPASKEAERGTSEDPGEDPSIIRGTLRPVTASAALPISADNWSKYTLTLTASETTHAGRLVLTFPAGTDLCLDMVSLFPADTFRGRKNGLRRDIAEALQELKPRFMRFPGGCLVHDGNLDKTARDSMYRWINTVGPVEERPSRRNNWRYNQTLGLGYYEYFCFCEDMGCEPLPVVPGGFNPHKGEGVDVDHIGEWVEETLALIEFATGDENTKYGALRASMGHPAPFGLKYIGVGNEEIGDGFFERYPYFHQAIRDKYPNIRIINSAGPFAVGEGRDAGWRSAVKYGSDLVDEHYYSSPEWFLANMHHYDDYDPNGPKVFLGEFASWGNTFYNALTEAAYMTHLEKAPAVGLACYAPLLCNADYVNWAPDLIWFNGHQVVKTPNYYVQQLFMTHLGNQEIAFEAEGFEAAMPLTDEKSISGAITIAGNDVAGEISDIQLTVLPLNSPAAFSVTRENEVHTVAESVTAENYALEFSFRRSEGRKGLRIVFGKKPGEDTYLLWEFGGWDNWDCNISTFVRGRASTISHRIFHVTDQPYRLRLEVSGRRIRTYVNGELMNDTVDRLPELEDLYISASKDTAGTVYLKCVNLTGENKEVQVNLPGFGGKTALGTLLTGGLSGENTFEKDTVLPKEFQKALNDKGFAHTFPAHSVTAFRIG